MTKTEKHQNYREDYAAGRTTKTQRARTRSAPLFSLRLLYHKCYDNPALFIVLFISCFQHVTEAV
jgi:hypothetical protein